MVRNEPTTKVPKSTSLETKNFVTLLLFSIDIVIVVESRRLPVILSLMSALTVVVWDWTDVVAVVVVVVLVVDVVVVVVVVVLVVVVVVVVVVVLVVVVVVVVFVVLVVVIVGVGGVWILI